MMQRPKRPCRLTRWLRAICCAFTLALAPSTTGTAAETEATWLGVLRLQLKAERDCDLALVLDQREIPLGQTTTLEGRIRCHDGREFDFTRRQPHERFQIKLCLPTYC